MKTETIQIIDRGRGAQLSTSRVTVQDLVPYFQEGCSHEEIIRWIPTLSAAEIAVVERYHGEHQESSTRKMLICECGAPNGNPPSVEKVLEEAHAERLAIMERLRKQQANGEAK